MNLLQKAAAMEDERPYDYGPPVPVKPSHELLGETLLTHGSTGGGQKGV